MQRPGFGTSTSKLGPRNSDSGQGFLKLIADSCWKILKYRLISGRRTKESRSLRSDWIFQKLSGYFRLMYACVTKCWCAYAYVMRMQQEYPAEDEILRWLLPSPRRCHWACSIAHLSLWWKQHKLHIAAHQLSFPSCFCVRIVRSTCLRPKWTILRRV